MGNAIRLPPISHTSRKYSMSRTKSRSVYITSLMASCRFFSRSVKLSATSLETLWIHRVPGSYMKEVKVGVRESRREAVPEHHSNSPC